MTANVAFYMKENLAERIGQTLTQLLRARLGSQESADSYEFDPELPQASASKLPTALEHALSEAAAIIEEGALKQYFEIDWLSYTSRSGFEGIPLQQESAPLKKESRLRGNPRHPILFVSAAEDTLLISGNGHLKTLPEHPSIVSLLNQLNTGEPRQVGVLIETAVSAAGEGAVPRDKLLELLREFLRWGVIAECP